MKRETVTRRDWNIMVDGLDGDLQETLNAELGDWPDSETCEHVEYRPDSLGRLDSESAPCPGVEPMSDQSQPSPHGPNCCGCRLDPVMNDERESCDVCSEATGSNDGVGWKIVFCPLHAAAPDLLEACKWLLDTMGRDSRVWCAIRKHPGAGEWIRHLRAAVAKAEPSSNP